MKEHLEIDPYNEEIWEEEDICKKNKRFSFLVVDGNEFEVSMDGFVIENRRGRYGEPLPRRNFDSTITFKNPFDKEKFLEYFDYFDSRMYARDYKKDMYIDVCDKEGLVIERTNLHGVLMKSFSLNENQVTIICDYWEKIYM